MTMQQTKSGLLLPSYRRDDSSNPALDTPEYRSSSLRHPKKPLQYLPHYLTEVTGPLLGHDRVGENDNDLTAQHDGEPLGERIIASGAAARAALSGHGAQGTYGTADRDGGLAPGYRYAPGALV